MNRFFAAAVMALAPAGAHTQEPWVAAPQAYKLAFENEWVRVLRIHYGPKEQIVAHDHAAHSAAFVYLNDSGPVVFNHLDTDYSAVTRAPTVARTFRVYYGLPETHEVINTSDLPSDFLRIEFKTVPKNDFTLKGKFPSVAFPPGENAQRVQVDHDQVRVTRLFLSPGKPYELTTGETEASLLVALTDGDLSVTTAAGVKRDAVRAGDTRFVSTSARQTLRSAGSTPIEALRIDLKTRPLTAEELTRLKDKKHKHD